VLNRWNVDVTRSPPSRARTDLHGPPDEIICVPWSLTMLLPSHFALRGQRLDRRRIATIDGV